MAGTVRRISVFGLPSTPQLKVFATCQDTCQDSAAAKSAKTYPDCNEETNCPSSVLKFWPGCSCDAFHEVGCGTCVFSMPWPLNLPKISEWSVFVSCTWTQYACDVIWDIVRHNFVTACHRLWAKARKTYRSPGPPAGKEWWKHPTLSTLGLQPPRISSIIQHSSQVVAKNMDNMDIWINMWFQKSPFVMFHIVPPFGCGPWDVHGSWVCPVKSLKTHAYAVWISLTSISTFVSQCFLIIIYSCIKSVSYLYIYIYIYGVTECYGHSQFQSKSAAEVEDQIIGFYMRYLVGEKARQSGNSLMSHIYAFLRDTHALQRKHGFPLLEESFSPHNSLLLHGTLFHALNLFPALLEPADFRVFGHHAEVKW